MNSCTQISAGIYIYLEQKECSSGTSIGVFLNAKNELYLRILEEKLFAYSALPVIKVRDAYFELILDLYFQIQV